MIRYACCVALSLGLAACGVDGEPETPQVDAALSLGSGGYVGGGIGVSQGPVSIFLGL